jgi:hypothetical protein
MKALVLLPLFAVLSSFAQTESPAPKDSPVEVIGHHWSSERQAAAVPDSPAMVPARAVIAENKNFRRKAREQVSPGMIDPNEGTIDGRSEALEKTVHNASTPVKDPVDGFAYRAVFRNATQTKIELIFWEYQFTERANPSNFVRRQFLCVANIKPGERKELHAFSTAGPSDVIAAESLANKPEQLFDEKVVVNRIEYSNGAILQRGDWDYKTFKSAIERATKTPWATEMCRPF